MPNTDFSHAIELLPLAFLSVFGTIFFLPVRDWSSTNGKFVVFCRMASPHLQSSLLGQVHYLAGPWRLEVARVVAALEATAASATGAPTAAGLAAAGGREDGGRRRRRRRRRQDGDIQNTS